PVTGDQLLGLRERPVDYRALAAREDDALALGAGRQSIAPDHDPRLDQLLVRQCSGLAVLGRLHDHHDSHRHPPGSGRLGRVGVTRLLTWRRTSRGEIDAFYPIFSTPRSRRWEPRAQARGATGAAARSCTAPEGPRASRTRS